MKKIIAICISTFVFLTTISAQMHRSIEPKTSTLRADWFGKVNQIVLPPFTSEDSAKFDFNDSRDGHMPTMAINIATNINLNNGGSWTVLPNNDRVWRVIIVGNGAQALAPLFDQLYLPPGASLHFYMPGKEEILGAFTNEITPKLRAFCPGLVHGATCVVEYYEPFTQAGKGTLSINKVAYAYRYITPLANDLKSAGACEVNVICPEGDNWRDQIRSVVKILVMGDTEAGFCSGALVNNVRKDCTPYILSAGHCIDHVTLASDYSQWVFYFNYQVTSCSDQNATATDQVNGCRQIAYSNDNDGLSGSDFEFVELDHAPPSAFNVYYSGWDITNTASPSGVGIHHPGGDIKKISTYTTTTTSTNVNGGVAHNTHWQVYWAPTTNGDGITEPGSSGSPLYNSNGLIIGHLTGGESCCTVGGCPGVGLGPNYPDIYGKIAYDWTSDGATPALQLKPWLDPDNTGATTLQGMNPPCSVAQQNDAGVEAIPEPTGNICSSTVTPFVILRNYGANALTSATINYKYDNGNLTVYHWTGNLSAGLNIIVQLPAATIGTGSHTFTAIITLPNGQTNTNTANTSLTSTFFVSNPGGNLLLTLATDDTGSKTTWQIADLATNVVASGGPYPDIHGGYTYNIPICLPLACYKFSIFSSAGNGMTNGVNGNYTLTDQSTGNILTSLQNPAFGASEVDNFCAVATGINQIAALNFSIIPNPSTGQFNINIQTGDEKTVQVFDITGQLILQRKTNEQNFIVDLSNQSKGIYILQIETANGKAVQKLVLK